MLLRFGVANHQSIYRYQELSLVASEAIKDKGPDLLEPANFKHKALPTVLIYGANASGKTALLSAIEALRNHVEQSFARRTPGEPIPHTPFLLNDEGVKEPTRFDCDLMVDGVRYHYGFEATDAEYVKEWLHSYPEGHRRVLFNRDSEKGEVEFGKTLKGQNQAIAKSMRKNSLFLSTAAQYEHADLINVYSEIAGKFANIKPTTNLEELKRTPINLGRNLEIDLIKKIDLGIRNVRIAHSKINNAAKYKNEKISFDAYGGVIGRGTPGQLPIGALNSGDIVLQFGHAAAEDKILYFDLEKESSGTIYSFSICVNILKQIEIGGIAMIDELDASLHPLISPVFVDLFMHKQTNPNGAQLIATTHDTNLLNAPSLRRDQVWFTEKNSIGETSIYPLTDYRTRNTDNIEKAYLEGRYGATPVIGPLDRLFKTEA